jgi:hypothetical protein
MKTFMNCEIAPAHITLKLRGGIVVYKVYGFAVKDREDEDYIIIKPDDLRRNPVMRIPVEEIESITAQYI